MAGYAKLWSGITESSLWDGSKEARLLFVSMLARADSVGFVEAAPSGLARIANLTKDEVAAALQELTSPDPESKSKVADGKRVAIVPRGFCVVNYEEYRARRDDDERREYMRQYMRDYRAGKKRLSDDVNSSKSSKPGLAQAEAEAEAETTTAAPSAPLLPKPKRRNLASLDIIKKDSDRQAFQSLWEDWPKRSDGKPSRGSRPKAELCFQKILEAGEVKAFELLEASAVYREEWSQVKEGWVQNVSTFLALEAGLWKQCVKVIRARSMEGV